MVVAVGLFSRVLGEILSRWAHYLAGVTWIGLLYYFNFVQTPSFAEFEAAPRTEAVRKLVPRALWWFRWGAMLTVLSGISILGFQHNFTSDYFKSPAGLSISTGILFGLIMFTNVWMIIWPNQKIFIENAERTAAGQDPLPNAASAARKAACASRTNTLFSIPLLFFMGATAHFADQVAHSDTAGGRATYMIVVLVVAVVFEGIALRAPAAGEPLAFYIDKHRNTIITGVAVWIVLFVVFALVFKF